MSMVTSNTDALRIAHIQRYVTIFDLLERMNLHYEVATQQIRCPFHNDHSPSARVYADQNKIFCFTEGRSWDVIDAAQSHLNCSLPEALGWLEQEFRIPGVAQTLQGTIRTQLASRLPPNARESEELVEGRLRSARRQLGFEKYTRLLMGLDLSVWEFSERRLKPEEFADRLVKLLGLLSSNVSAGGGKAAAAGAGGNASSGTTTATPSRVMSTIP